MNLTSCIAAIAIALVQIFVNNGQNEKLSIDHPEVSERDYHASNLLMIILIIVEVFFLITSFVNK